MVRYPRRALAPDRRETTEPEDPPDRAQRPCVMAMETSPTMGTVDPVRPMGHSRPLVSGPPAARSDPSRPPRSREGPREGNKGQKFQTRSRDGRSDLPRPAPSRAVRADEDPVPGTRDSSASGGRGESRQPSPMIVGPGNWPPFFL